MNLNIKTKTGAAVQPLRFLAVLALLASLSCVGSNPVSKSLKAPIGPSEQNLAAECQGSNPYSCPAECKCTFTNRAWYCRWEKLIDDVRGCAFGHDNGRIAMTCWHDLGDGNCNSFQFTNCMKYKSKNCAKDIPGVCYDKMGFCNKKQIYGDVVCYHGTFPFGLSDAEAKEAYDNSPSC